MASDFTHTDPTDPAPSNPAPSESAPSTSRPAVIGIDVGGSRKGFHAVALQAGAYIGQLASKDVAELAHWCRSVIGAQLIGIDAPGRWSADGRARPCERQLNAAGIRCFASPSREAALGHPTNYFGWMLQGEALYKELERSHPLLASLSLASLPLAAQPLASQPGVTRHLESRPLEARQPATLPPLGMAAADLAPPGLAAAHLAHCDQLPAGQAAPGPVLAGLAAPGLAASGLSCCAPACFETFPHAITWQLRGGQASAAHKRVERSQLLQQAGLDPAPLSSIDLIDAALCALAAHHLASGLPCRAYGEPDSGLIVVPRGPLAADRSHRREPRPKGAPAGP